MVTDEYRRLFGSLADESLRVVVLLKLEGHSNEEIAKSLDCGLRTVERKLDVIRTSWLAEDSAMSEDPKGGGCPIPSSLSATQAEELDRACDRFEAAWRAGGRPDLARYLAEAGEAWRWGPDARTGGYRRVLARAHRSAAQPGRVSEAVSRRRCDTVLTGDRPGR